MTPFILPLILPILAFEMVPVVANYTKTITMKLCLLKDIVIPLYPSVLSHEYFTKGQVPSYSELTIDLVMRCAGEEL